MDTTCNIQQCWELLANNVASVCTDGNMIVLKAIGLNSRQQQKLSTCITPFFYISVLSLHIFSRILQNVNTRQRFSFFFKLTYSPLEFSSRKFITEHLTYWITWNMAEHISLAIYVSQKGEHISLGICLSQVGEQISIGICVS